MRASSKARGEAKAISCVRSYSAHWFHHFSAAVSFVFTSRFPALNGKFSERMAGAFLALAQFGKKPVNVVSARGGQFVLYAPDLLEHQVSAARWFECFGGFHGVM